MPWYINPNTYDDRMLEWSDAWGKAGPPADYYVRLGSDHGKAPRYLGCIPLQLETDHSLIPNVGHGRMSTQLMLSKEAMEIIKSFDPVDHHFIPLELHLRGGKVVTDEYFLFQAADRVNGIIEEKSNVTSVYDDDGGFLYFSTPSRPSITWAADAVEGRHIWVGQNLAWDVFISDELEREFMKLGNCVYDKLPSFVA